MVSIIPGIEALEPDRTLTRSGAAASPIRAPMDFSSRATAAVTSARTSSGMRWVFE